MDGVHFKTTNYLSTKAIGIYEVTNVTMIITAVLFVMR